MTALANVLLIGLGLIGLAMIPLGLPGLWVMVGGIIAYGWLTDFRSVGVVMIAIVLGIAFLGEIIDNWLGFRFAKRYGGSTRSGWGRPARWVGRRGDRRADRRRRQRYLRAHPRALEDWIAQSGNRVSPFDGMRVTWAA